MSTDDPLRPDSERKVFKAVGALSGRRSNTMWAMRAKTACNTIGSIRSSVAIETYEHEYLVTNFPPDSTLYAISWPLSRIPASVITCVPPSKRMSMFTRVTPLAFLTSQW